MQKVKTALKKMKSFSRIKKNMFQPIRDGIENAVSEITNLRKEMVLSDSYLLDFEWNLRDRMRQSIKEVSLSKKKDAVEEGTQTPLQPAPRSHSDTRKRIRETTVSSELTADNKPEEKRLKTSEKPKECVKVPAGKDVRKKKKPNPEIERSERPKRPARRRC